MENRPWQIYTLSDPRTNQIRYIGVTFRGKQRFNEHISRAVKGGKTHRDCWIRSLISAGVRPVCNVVETGAGDGWQDAERRWIATHRALSDLTNHTDGGDGTPGCVPTAETLAKLSASRKGKKYAPGRIAGMLGKHHSPEVREKIKAAGTGRVYSDTSRALMSKKAKERGVSQTTREACIAKLTGAKLTEAHKAKIKASTTGRKPVLSVETGEVYSSVTEAALKIGVSKPSIYQAIRNGFRCKGNHLQFVDTLNG